MPPLLAELAAAEDGELELSSQLSSEPGDVPEEPACDELESVSEPEESEPGPEPDESEPGPEGDPVGAAEPEPEPAALEGRRW